jgi:hypothetical protein
MKPPLEWSLPHLLVPTFVGQCGGEMAVAVGRLAKSMQQVVFGPAVRQSAGIGAHDAHAGIAGHTPDLPWPGTGGVR